MSRRREPQIQAGKIVFHEQYTLGSLSAHEIMSDSIPGQRRGKGANIEPTLGQRLRWGIALLNPLSADHDYSRF